MVAARIATLALAAALGAAAQGVEAKIVLDRLVSPQPAVHDSIGVFELDAALRRLGLDVTQIVGDPDPRVDATTAGGIIFSARLQSCDPATSPRICTRIRFEATFPPDTTTATSDVVNAFHLERPIGRIAFDDSNRMILSHVVLLEGGITADSLDANIGLWLEALDDLSSRFGL